MPVMGRRQPRHASTSRAERDRFNPVPIVRIHLNDGAASSIGYPQAAVDRLRNADGSPADVQHVVNARCLGVQHRDGARICVRKEDSRDRRYASAAEAHRMRASVELDRRAKRPRRRVDDLHVVAFAEHQNHTAVLGRRTYHLDRIGCRVDTTQDGAAVQTRQAERRRLGDRHRRIRVGRGRDRARRRIQAHRGHGPGEADWDDTQRVVVAIGSDRVLARERQRCAHAGLAQRRDGWCASVRGWRRRRFVEWDGRRRGADGRPRRGEIVGRAARRGQNEWHCREPRPLVNGHRYGTRGQRALN